MNQNEPKQSNATHNQQNSRPIFPYHAHNQSDFGKPFINERDFIYLDISKMGFIFDYTSIIVGRWKSRFKIFEFKCLRNQ